jgi:hypothetical protein
VRSPNGAASYFGLWGWHDGQVSNREYENLRVQTSRN